LLRAGLLATRLGTPAQSALVWETRA